MFTKLLVPLDRSALSEEAVGQAATLARASNAAIDLITVHEPFAVGGYDDAPWNSEELRAEEAYLGTLAGELAAGASVAVTHAVLRGGPAAMIRARAKEIGADLIVMTSHGRTGLSRAWLGSVADAVVRSAHIPVLMLRPVESSADRLAARHTFKKILIPLDGSPLSVDAIDTAVALAKASGASVTLLQVVQPLPMLSAIDATAAMIYPPMLADDKATSELAGRLLRDLESLAVRLHEQHDLAVDATVVIGSGVARSIVDFARGNRIDAIAMSTHGRGASRFLLGSVADKVLRSSGLPVLLRRPAGVPEQAALITSADVIDQLPAMAI